MNILEFQSKELCKQFNIPVPENMLLNSIDPILYRFAELQLPFILKAQVPSKKRARRGGICLARSWAEAEEMASSMFTRQIDNRKVDCILVEKLVDFRSSFSITIKRNSNDYSTVLSVSKSLSSLEEIKPTSKGNDAATQYPINPYFGLLEATMVDVCSVLELDKSDWSPFKSILNNIWEMFDSLELASLEISPLVAGNDSKIYVLGIDLEIDRNVLFRQPELAKLIRCDSDQYLEPLLCKQSCDFSVLDGDIAIISSSLEMSAAIQDILKPIDGKPSILIGVTGGVFAERISQILEIIEHEKKSKIVILHSIGRKEDYSRILEGIGMYHSRSMDPLPIILRIPNLSPKVIGKQIDTKKLVMASSMKEIPALIKKYSIGNS